MSGDKISIFLIYDQNIELLSKGIISQLTEALARADPNQKERKNEKTKNKQKKKTRPKSSQKEKEGKLYILFRFDVNTGSFTKSFQRDNLQLQQ